MRYFGELIGGTAIAYGANYSEEFLTEMVTEIAQTYEREYSEALASGRIDRSLGELDRWKQFTQQRPLLGEFWDEHEGQFYEAGRIGGNMSLLMGSGQVAATYGVAGLEATTFKGADLEPRQFSK